MDKLGPYQLNTIITGDARELAKAIPDESVDLIFTDPVYDRIDDYRWLAEMAARILKPSGSLIMEAGHYFLPRIFQALVNTDLMFVWLLCERYRGINRVMHQLKLIVGWKPFLWYSKGKRYLAGDFVFDAMDVTTSSENMERNHKWRTAIRLPKELINRQTEPGAIVFDPFTGGGTVPAVCKMLGRRYLAFEIEPETAERARERVRLTQPPLFVLQPEQLELSID